MHLVRVGEITFLPTTKVDVAAVYVHAEKEKIRRLLTLSDYRKLSGQVFPVLPPPPPPPSSRAMYLSYTAALALCVHQLYV